MLSGPCGLCSKRVCERKEEMDRYMQKNDFRINGFYPSLKSDIGKLTETAKWYCKFSFTTWKC